MEKTRKLIEARLAFVRKELAEVLNHLQQDFMTWAPAEGMRTVGGQLIEIAGSELQVLIVMKEGRYITDDEVKERLGDKDNLNILLDFLSRVRHETLAYLASLSDKDLTEEIALTGWHESIGLPTVPRSEIFRGIAQHETYHTGQLVSYLWTRGDNPYKW